MAKKRSAGGAAHLRRKGLRSVLVPVRQDVHTALARAAALADPPASIAEWTAAALEEAARLTLKGAGLPWPEEKADSS